MALTQKTYTVIACDLPGCEEFYVPREDTEPPKRWKKVTIAVDNTATDQAATISYNACTITHANELADTHVTIE